MARSTGGLKWPLAVVGALALTLPTLPAQADEQTSDTIESIENVAPEVFQDVAEVMTDESATYVVDATVGTVDVRVPSDPADGIKLTSTGMVPLTVGLPNAEEASDGVVEESGVVSYDNHDGSMSTTIVKEDGSVQIVTTIASADAPTSYAYNLAVLETGHAESLDNGRSVIFFDAGGNFAGAFAPAWAKDANGVEVPTRYVIDGATVTQEVDHSSGAYTYPVVADPWAGIALIHSWHWTGSTGQWRMNVVPTPYSRSLNAATTGVMYQPIGYAGWDELANKQSSTQRARMNVSMQQQYVCHQGYASHDFPEWNVEGWKSAKGSVGEWVWSLCN